MKQAIFRRIVFLLISLSISYFSYSQLSATTAVTNVSCNGGSNGAIDLTVTGGVTPYYYIWSNSATLQDISGLTAGSYTVTVTDSNGPTVGPFTWNYIQTTSSHTILLQPNTITVNGSYITTGDYVGAFFTLPAGGMACGGYVMWVGSMTSVAAWPDDNLTADKDGFAANEAFNWKVWHITGGSNGVVVNMTATYSFGGGNFVTNGMSGVATMTGTYNNAATTTATATVSAPAAITITGTTTNPSCFGGTNGLINITAIGGTTPYAYLWSNGANSQNINNIGSGTYTVTVTDSHLCTQTANFTLTAPTQLLLSAFGTNVSCNGGSNGAIDIWVIGGTTPYSYHWQNNATTEDISGITAGSYSITVTDGGTCTVTTTYTITQPSAITVTNATINVSCNGYTDGYIGITVTGGTPSYTYNWSNNATTQNISALSAGNYTLTVTDTNSCNYTATYPLTQPGALTLSTIITSVSCFGGSNGSIDLSVTGGTTPYTYHWQNNATSQDLINIAAGVYTVTVTDNHSCFILGGPYFITQSALLTATASPTGVSCNGGSNGSVTSTVNGGTAPYTYHWSNNATTQNLTGITAGTYSLTVTDVQSCFATASAIVLQPSALALSTIGTNISCFGGMNGAVNLTVTGGTVPYTFHWNTNAVTEDLNNVAAGTYYVTVTDFNACTSTISATITQPASLSIITIPSNYNGYNISYYGGTDGSIDITVGGGTAPYTFLWSNSATTEDLSNIGAGNYSVTVTDSHLCTMNSSIVMTQPAQNSSITVTGVETNVSCNGGSNGTINITVSGGTPPYSYSWSNGATVQDINNLSAGAYTVTVHDSGNIIPSFEWSYIITTANHNIAIQTGTTFINGNPIQNGDYIGVFYNTAGGLACGGYINWTGANNSVTAWGDDSMTPPKDGFDANEAFNWKVWNTQDGCAIDMVATYSTSQPNQGNFVANGLSAIATLTGTGTCPPPGPDTEIFTISVTQPSEISITGVINNVTCSGGSNGSVLLTVTGGTPPYSYLWSTGATAQNLTGATAGTYNITVTDNHLCTSTNQFVVGEQASLTLTYILSDYLGFNISVNGGNDGWIDLSVSGGVPPYYYLWSNGSIDQDLNNLTAGTYNVMVTDSYACPGTASITLTEPDPVIPLQATYITDNVSCFGWNDGSINLTVTGGETPYTYFWSNNQTTEDISGLTAGTYSVTIVDNSGTYGGPFNWNYILTSSSHTILVLSNAVNLVGPPVQNGDYIGIFYNLPTGGTGCGGYLVWDGSTNAMTAWGDDALTSEKDGFSDGEVFTWKYKRQSDGYEAILNPTYMPPGAGGISNDSTFTNNGMSGVSNLTAIVPPTILPQILVVTIVVTQPPAVVVTASPDVSTCLGTAVTISVTGNALTYLWSNGFNGTSQSVNPANTTTYIVTGTDANGCTATDEVVVTVNPLPVVDLGVDQTVTVNTPVTLDADTFDAYEWSTGASTQTITLANTTVGSFDYSVTVTDANDCEGSDEVTITVTYEIIEVDKGSLISIYPNPGTDYFNVVVEFKQPTDFSITIINIDGKEVMSRDMKDMSVFREKFDISGFAKGTYLIKVISKKDIKVEEFVIQ